MAVIGAKAVNMKYKTGFRGASLAKIKLLSKILSSKGKS